MSSKKQKFFFLFPGNNLACNGSIPDFILPGDEKAAKV